MKTALIIAAALTVTACASTHEVAVGPDAYWINSVPADVAKLEAEHHARASYNQPATRFYLNAVRVSAVALSVALLTATPAPPPVPVIP